MELITGVRHDDPKDTGALSTCQAFFIGDMESEEVNSPSMQGQERFEIEEKYGSNWCEASVKPGEVTFAEEILDQMVQTEYDIGLGLISSGYARVLKGYCQSRVLRKALCIFQEMKEDSLPCDQLVYTTLLEGCIMLCDGQVGCDLFREMIYKGLMPSAITTSIMSRLFQRSGFADQEVLEVCSPFDTNRCGFDRRLPRARRTQRQVPQLASPNAHEDQATANVFAASANRDKIAELEQALAGDNF